MAKDNLTLNLDGKTISKLSNYIIAFFGFLAVLFLFVLPILIKKDIDPSDSDNYGIGRAFASDKNFTDRTLIGIFTFISFAGSVLMIIKGCQGKVNVCLPILLIISTLFIGFAAPETFRLGTGSIINLILFGLSTLLSIASNIIYKEGSEEKVKDNDDNDVREIEFY